MSSADPPWEFHGQVSGSLGALGCSYTFSLNPPEPRFSKLTRLCLLGKCDDMYGRLAKVFPNNDLFNKRNNSEFMQGDRSPK